MDFLFLFIKTESFYVGQADLKCLIFLTLSPKHWDCKNVLTTLGPEGSGREFSQYSACWESVKNRVHVPSIQVKIWVRYGTVLTPDLEGLRMDQ